jgi:hypothetical protein
VVAGKSVFTAKLWPTALSAILSIYGPTDMNDLRYLVEDPLAGLDISAPKSATLHAATNFARPLTNTPAPTATSEWLTDRARVGLDMFQAEATMGFLLRSLTILKDETGKDEYTFPKTGRVSKEEVDQISKDTAHIAAIDSFELPARNPIHRLTCTPFHHRQVHCISAAMSRALQPTRS